MSLCLSTLLLYCGDSWLYRYAIVAICCPHLNKKYDSVTSVKLKWMKDGFINTLVCKNILISSMLAYVMVMGGPFQQWEALPIAFNFRSGVGHLLSVREVDLEHRERHKMLQTNHRLMRVWLWLRIRILSLFDALRAVPSIIQVVEIKPDWPKGYSRLGAAHYGLGDFEEAKSAYNKGLERDKLSKQSGSCVNFIFSHKFIKMEIFTIALNIKQSDILKNQEKFVLNYHEFYYPSRNRIGCVSPKLFESVKYVNFTAIQEPNFKVWKKRAQYEAKPPRYMAKWLLIFGVFWHLHR